MEKEQCDFSGYATRNDLLCGDGRTIRKNAFKDCDGATVPLVYNHQHNDPNAVLGHAILENRDDGVYAYCKFNETPQGKTGRELVEHGDVRSLSIYANQLKQIGSDVVHGVIRELSLVLAGANPGAYIDFVMAHGDGSEDCLYANYDENALTIYHSDDKKVMKETEETKVADEKKTEETKSDEGKSIQDVLDTMNKEQLEACYYLVGKAAEAASAEDNDSEEGEDNDMKQNVFEQDNVTKSNVLTHADQEMILKTAKETGVGSLQKAIKMFSEQNDSLAHGLDLGDTEVLEELLPDHKLLNPGAPEIIRDFDNSWVMEVIRKIHKSPYARIRTRKADARAKDLRAKGYKKGEEKKLTEHIKLLGRKTDPTTVYLKDELNRDDIIDITDFDIVSYIWSMMNDNMYETLALAALVGDGREDIDPDKINEENIRPIWKDDDFYTIHYDIDIEAARKELQGSNTSANFGENYIYSEAMVTASLYSREKFEGTGLPTLYCDPHFVNIMLLARDLNGRRIYDSKADLAKALNVSGIVEIEHLKNKVRTTEDGKKKKLLCLLVNLADYQFGSVKGGELTKFTDFDIDFNKYKYLMETRLSGALTEPYSAIAIEEDITEVAEG